MNSGCGAILGARWVAMFVMAAALALGSGCGTGGHRTGASMPVCCSNQLAAVVPLRDKSIYQVDSSWTNDLGSTVALSSLRGRPQVVTMFFARCEYACPVLVHDMKRIEAALPEVLRKRVGFVLVSFDTERDTQAALAGYRRAHELAAGWTLLRGASDDVLELAALLGVKYRKDSRGQFDHSNLITVLNAEGEVAFQQVGLNQSVDEVVALLTRLAGN